MDKPAVSLAALLCPSPSVGALPRLAPAQGHASSTWQQHPIGDPRGLSLVFASVDTLVNTSVWTHSRVATRVCTLQLVFPRTTTSVGITVHNGMHGHGATDAKCATCGTCMHGTQGSWSLKHDAGNKIVVLRSLLYPGYVHFNMVANSAFGAIYIGSGARNNDLAFML